MFGRSLGERGARMEACLTALRTAWTGEPFEFEGRPVQVTPTPTTPGGPLLMYGGGSVAAARRAARFGLSFFAQTSNPGLEAAYADECARVGTTAGMCIVPAPGAATTMFVAEDVDEGWDRFGPYLLHDARMYAAWLGTADAASRSDATTVADLRAEGGAYRVLTPAQAVDYVHTTGPLTLHPLCGGCPPALAWSSLELIAAEVLPAL